MIGGPRIFRGTRGSARIPGLARDDVAIAVREDDDIARNQMHWRLVGQSGPARSVRDDVVRHEMLDAAHHASCNEAAFRRLGDPRRCSLHVEKHRAGQPDGPQDIRKRVCGHSNTAVFGRIVTSRGISGDIRVACQAPPLSATGGGRILSPSIRVRPREAERDGNQESTERMRRLAARHDPNRRRRPRLWPARRPRTRPIRLQPRQPGSRSGAVGQDPRGLRVVRRQRRTEHDRAVRRCDVLQASADHRHQGTRPAEDRRAVRLAQVDARHEAAVRRRQGRDRARRGLRPAVVLALHVGVVLAYGRSQ